jgi:CBS domain containing-hemolysin-like protein
VLDRLGRIPTEGDALVYDGWRIEVAEMDRRRIARVRLTAPRRARVDTVGTKQ